MTECNSPGLAAPRPGTTLHPLGPLIYRVAARRPGRARAAAGGIFIGCAILLAVASQLEPDSAGLGSHQQLGLPPCSMLVIMGYPCPTCGMTTAFAHTVRGQLASAFLAQPAGFALAMATVAAASLALSTVLTGRVWAVNWYRVSPTWVVLGVVFLVVGGWAYKLVWGLVTGSLPVAM